MGSMYEIRCECGYELRIFHSIGMMYPLACQERMKAVRKGQYGEEMKKADNFCLIYCRASTLRMQAFIDCNYAFQCKNA